MDTWLSEENTIDHEPILMSIVIGGAALSGAFSVAQRKGSVSGAISPREVGFAKGRLITCG